jgi:hypothetical protein
MHVGGGEVVGYEYGGLMWCFGRRWYDRGGEEFECSTAEEEEDVFEKTWKARREISVSHISSHDSTTYLMPMCTSRGLPCQRVQFAWPRRRSLAVETYKNFVDRIQVLVDRPELL